MITKEGKRSIVIHSVIFAAWVGLVVFASFRDLEISRALSNGDSFLGALIAKVAEWPAYSILPLSSVVLFYNGDLTKNKRVNATIKAIFALVNYGGWTLWFIASEKLVEVPHEIGFSLVYAAIFSAASLYFGKFVNKDVMKKLFKFAIFALIVLAATQLVITLVKNGWSRARYRDMLKYDSFEMFTPWYKPNGFRKIDGYRLTSFPSGHTNSATNLFILTALCYIFPSWKKRKTLVYLLIGAFVALTMVYRVVYNAHFLSDTLWGAFISYVIFYIAKRITFRGGKYTFEETTKESEGSTEGEKIAE